MLKYKVIMKNQSEKMLDGVLTAVMDSDSDVPADSLTLTCPYDSEIRLHGDRLKVLDADKLVENIQKFIDYVVSLKPATVKGVYVKSIAISATMSPGVRVLLQ